MSQRNADIVAKHPRPAKFVTNPCLRIYVEGRLSERITRPAGTVMNDPVPLCFTGRSKPHRKGRAWSWAWNPGQISHPLKIELSAAESMRISHEALTSRYMLRVAARSNANWPGPCATSREIAARDLGLR